MLVAAHHSSIRTRRTDTDHAQTIELADLRWEALWRALGDVQGRPADDSDSDQHGRSERDLSGSRQELSATEGLLDPAIGERGEHKSRKTRARALQRRDVEDLQVGEQRQERPVQQVQGVRDASDPDERCACEGSACDRRRVAAEDQERCARARPKRAGAWKHPLGRHHMRRGDDRSES